MRIRARLLLLVLAVLIPAFAAAGIGMAYVYQEAQESNRQSMREVARALALVLDKEIAQRDAVLTTLASSYALDAGDLYVFYQQARRIAPNPDTAIILHDVSGKVLLNTRLAPGTRNIPATPLITELRRSQGPRATIVSSMYVAPVGNQNAFSIQIPVMRNDRILYYIEMCVFASHLQSVFLDQQLPADWIGTIVDQNDAVVARNVRANEFIGEFASEPIRAKMRTYTEGFNEGNSLSGESVYAYFSRAPNFNWKFIISVPKAQVQLGAIRATAWVGLVSLLLLGLAITAALGVGRHTAHSIEALRKSAAGLGSGEEVSAKHSGIEEMDDVNQAMAQASRDLRHAREELERRVQEAVATAERSQRALLQGQKLEALGRLTGGIAHDFNNVLQTLTTGLQVATLSAKEARVVSVLQACQRAVARGAELTRQLMAFGRIQDASLQTIDLAQQVNAARPLLTGALPSNIQFHLECDANLWPVTLDPMQLELALLNLVINARDAMPEGGAITLRVHNHLLQTPLEDLAPGEYVRLLVTDSGKGMSEEIVARALDPFFTTKEIGKGTGMGLPQAYGFTRQSGGTLVLRSQSGLGTVITMYFPRVNASVSAPLPSTTPLHHPRAAGTILFVEDDPLVRETVRPALEVAGLHVTAADNGKQALDLLESGMQFDLVFSDIVMPGGVSGIDLAHIVRERFPRMRLVLATGYSERRVTIPGVRMLAKPYDLGELTTALNAELNREPNTSQA